MLVGSLRGNVQLKCDIAADVWPVEVDIAELELALVNIAVNARDAMPGGGIITLSARNVTLKKSDGVDQLEGDFVALAMTDTGVGIRARRAAADLRAVLHHQGARQGHRSRAVAGLRLLPSIGRAPWCDQRGRQRHHDHHLSAAQHAGAGRRRWRRPPTQPIAPGQGTILVVEDNTEVAAVTAPWSSSSATGRLRAENATDALNTLHAATRSISCSATSSCPAA